MVIDTDGGDEIEALIVKRQPGRFRLVGDGEADAFAQHFGGWIATHGRAKTPFPQVQQLPFSASDIQPRQVF